MKVWLSFYSSIDPQAYLSLYQEKQQHLKEEDGSLNQIAVVDYLASMVSLSTIRPTLLIQYFTQDQIDQIMKSYYFHLIEFSVFFIFICFSLDFYSTCYYESC